MSTATFRMVRVANLLPVLLLLALALFVALCRAGNRRRDGQISLTALQDLQRIFVHGLRRRSDVRIHVVGPGQLALQVLQGGVGFLVVRSHGKTLLVRFKSVFQLVIFFIPSGRYDSS